MLGGGWALFNLRERQIYLDSSEGFNIVTMIWKKESHKLLGSYFFLQRGRVITNPWKNKLYLMWDAVTKRRTDGALVRVELIVSPGESNEDAFCDLKDFLVNLWPILPDYVPGYTPSLQKKYVTGLVKAIIQKFLVYWAAFSGNNQG